MSDTLSPVDRFAEDPSAAFAWLDAHVNLESLGVPAGTDRRATSPTLERMEALAALLGSPQLEYGCVHVTGTNGKTSVSRLTSALLTAAGASTGLFTSPHLVRVNERISWDGHPIDDVTLADRLAQVALIEPHLGAVPSWFEILTGVALTWFADVAVDGAVLEVGLGGTWDATNVVDAAVAVVTNVELDHTEYLGDTRAAIAAEKAGIVVPGATLVLGETDPALETIFTDRGPAHTWLRGRDFGVTRSVPAVGGRLVDLFTPRSRHADVFLPLHGAHQADNAAIALAAAEAFLEEPIDAEVAANALASASSPGRLEVVGARPLVVLDGAHNVDGARHLRTALDETFPAPTTTLVLGLLREKDPAEMLVALDAVSFDRIVLCAPPSPRARDPREVAAIARDLGVAPERVTVVDAVADAVARAVDETSEDGLVVVTGSLYAVGAARAALGVA